MKVAYLVNYYPKVSHTFIRREILALEALGYEVERYAVRRVEEAIVSGLREFAAAEADLLSSWGR